MTLPRALSAVSVRCAIAVLLGSALHAAQLDLKAVALVASLDGHAQVSLPGGGGRRALTLFDRLPAGARIETGSGTTLLLVYRSGSRVRIAAASAVSLTDGDVTVARGHVERLSSVAPLPAFDPPSADLRPGIAAVRIRGTGIEALYPAGGARALADAAVLAFAARPGHGTYTIHIEDDRGRIVFSAQTTASPVAVPAGTLKPDGAYLWRVSGRTPVGTALRGEARFATLSAAEAAWRTDARRRAGPEASTAWLAEIDLALGLWREAHDGFRAAAGAQPGDADVIARRLESLARVIGAAQAR